jgi:flagellar hook-associated protein FlgK
MSTVSAIDANGALSSAIHGMTSASRIMDNAAKSIAKSSLDAVNPASSSSSKDSVSLSYQSQSRLESASMEESMTDMMVAGTSYTANAKIVEAADSMTGTLLNMVV